MLNSETITAVERLIENFGFPIFVALCGLFFFWQMFAYMKATVTKKDDDFLAYIQAANKQFADYVTRRDEQIGRIVENQNRAFQENSHTLAYLSDTLNLRIQREDEPD